MQATADIETKRKSSTALFMDGFFSVMSYPFIFDHPKADGKATGRARFEIPPPDIGRYFQRVGEMLSDAYRREVESLGIEVEHE